VDILNDTSKEAEAIQIKIWHHPSRIATVFACKVLFLFSFFNCRLATDE